MQQLDLLQWTYLLGIFFGNVFLCGFWFFNFKHCRWEIIKWYECIWNMINKQNFIFLPLILFFRFSFCQNDLSEVTLKSADLKWVYRIRLCCCVKIYIAEMWCFTADQIEFMFVFCPSTKRFAVENQGYKSSMFIHRVISTNNMLLPQCWLPECKFPSVFFQTCKKMMTLRKRSKEPRDLKHIFVQLLLKTRPINQVSLLYREISIVIFFLALPVAKMSF